MDNKHVEPGEVLQLMNEHSILLDTLPAEHFQRIHIPGAQNSCVFEVSFVKQVTAIVPDRNTQIIVYGSSRRSRDATVAAEKLARAGYERVSILAGGLEAWKNAGYTVAGSTKDLPDDPGTRIILSDGGYHLDRGKSYIEWAGRNQNGRHFGTLNFSEGSLVIESGIMQGMLEVDMHSMKNINLAGDELQPVLLAHLQSDDFFFVDHFPTAVYRMTEGRLIEKAYATAINCTIQGELSLRGSTAGLDFEATLTTPSENRINMEAHFDLDRTRWQIIYGSARYFEHLGMHTVFDAISLQLCCSYRTDEAEVREFS